MLPWTVMLTMDGEDMCLEDFGSRFGCRGRRTVGEKDSDAVESEVGDMIVGEVILGPDVGEEDGDAMDDEVMGAVVGAVVGEQDGDAVDSNTVDDDAKDVNAVVVLL